MVFARRSFIRATTTAAQSFRSAPATRRSGQVLGRRFYASGKGHEEHKSSDLPWLLGSVGIGGPVIVYLLQTGPEKKPHGDAHGAHKEEHKEEKKDSQPAAEEKTSDQTEQKPKEGGQQTDEKKDEGKPSQEEKVGSEKTGHDEPAGMKPPGGPNSMSAKQEGVSNTDSMNPYINEEGKSEKGEGETDTVKVKGTVKPERPQQ